MKTKKGKIVLIILVAFLVITFDVILFIMMRRINMGIIFSIIIFMQIIVLLCYLVLWAFRFSKFYSIVRSIIIVVLVAILSLLPVYLIFKYNNEHTYIKQGEVLTFYGEYLTFLGAFSLGYFIYKKDESHRIEQKKSKCKLLLACIEKADNDMLRIAENTIKPTEIRYDRNWREYYLEFESLTKRKYYAMKETIKEFFDTVDLINLELAKGNYEKAKIVFKNHVIYDCYSIRKYNMIELNTLIMSVLYYNEIYNKINFIPWDEKAEVKIAIDEFSGKYFRMVENYIYNYMIKTNNTIVNHNEIKEKLVDWLLTSPHIKKIAKSPEDKRIVNKIVFNISLQLDKKSQRLSYDWAEYKLK